MNTPPGEQKDLDELKRRTTSVLSGLQDSGVFDDKEHFSEFEDEVWSVVQWGFKRGQASRDAEVADRDARIKLLELNLEQIRQVMEEFNS